MVSDLKPENFLFINKNELYSLQMIDFGLAKKYTVGMKLLETKAGTAYYVAPEVLKGQYNNKCDIWSAGVILYVLLCGYPPFYGETEKEILEQVQLGDFQFDGVEWNSVSTDAKELLCNMITQCDVRFNTRDVIHHQWVQKFLQQEYSKEKDKAYKVFNQFHMERWDQYSALKQASLLYLATQLKNEDISEIKQAFLIVNQSQSGFISHQELLTYFGANTIMMDEVNRLEYFSTNYHKLNNQEFTAICLNDHIVHRIDHLQLLFYFLKSQAGPFIDNHSIQQAFSVQIPLPDDKIDFNTFVSIIKCTSQ